MKKIESADSQIAQSNKIKIIPESSHITKKSDLHIEESLTLFE